MQNKKEIERGILSEAALLLKPKAIVKIVASEVPFLGGAISHIEGERVDRRISFLEGHVEDLRELQRVESKITAPAMRQSWPVAVGEILKHTVDIAITWDEFDSRNDEGKLKIQVVGHACLLSEREAIVAKEVLATALKVAERNSGQVVILRDMAMYSFEEGPVDKASGVHLLTSLVLNEKMWKDWVDENKANNLNEPSIASVKAINVSISPFLGQEIGFIHAGEAAGTIRTGHFSDIQFEVAHISCFKFPTQDGLKRFVSTVIGARILHLGSPVFDCDGILLGLVSGVEWYENDAGRRIVVRSLLGHPRFSGKA